MEKCLDATSMAVVAVFQVEEAGGLDEMSQDLAGRAPKIGRGRS